MFKFSGKIGRSIIQRISMVSGLMSLLYYSLVAFFRPGAKGRTYTYRITIAQIYFTGVQAVSIISVIAVSLGVVVIYQISVVASNFNFGFNAHLGEILVIVLVRLLGPLLTAIIVIARSGTAIATEIANMMLKNEMAALESMGIDTLTYVVLPRIVGMVFSLIMLNIFFDFMSIIGGSAVAKIIDPTLRFENFFGNFFDNLSPFDLLELLVKSTVFACGISLICIINGFKVFLYPGGVPVSGIKGVVGSLIFVFFANALISVIFLL